MAAGQAAAVGTLPAGLTGDTLEAAKGSPDDGMGFVGVWARAAEDCARIDQAGASFAVITSSTFRNGASACYGNFGALADGQGALAMFCPSGGGDVTVTLAQSTPDALTVDGTPMVRCKP